MTNFLKSNFVNLMGQMRSLFILNIMMLMGLFLCLQCYQNSFRSEVKDAQDLYRGMDAISSVQEAAGKFNGTLESAGQIFKSKNIHKKYRAEMDDVRKKLGMMKADLVNFESTQEYYAQASLALDGIDKVASKIFADDWSANQFGRYISSIKKRQKEFNQSLIGAVVEMDTLMSEKFESIENNGKKPFQSGLLLTLIFCCVIGILNFFFYRRANKHFS